MLAFALLFLPVYHRGKLFARAVGGADAAVGARPGRPRARRRLRRAQGADRRDLVLPARQPRHRHGLRPAAPSGRNGWRSRAPIRCSTPAAARSSTGSRSAAAPWRPGVERISMIRLHDTMAREKRAFVPADPEAHHHVCLRADGLRPRPYRQCPPGGGVRHARPAAPPQFTAPTAWSMPATSPTSTTRSSTPRAAEGVDPSVITERYERFYLDDMGALGVAPPDIAPHATAEIARDGRDDRAADRDRQRL